MRSSLILLLLAVSSWAQSGPRRSVHDLAFMSGDWQSKQGMTFSEESWSQPHGDNMTRFFREIEDGKAVFFEFLIIEQTPSGPVLKLKHFNAGLIGWENKDEVVSFDMSNCARSSSCSAILRRKPKSRTN